MQKIGIVVCGNSGIDYIDHEFDIPVIRSILLMRGKDIRISLILAQKISIKV